MRKLVLDANLIVAFVIGTVNPKLLGAAKRVKEYQPEDYDLLFRYISLFDEVILLPNTLTEASNLSNHLKGDRRDECLTALAQLTRSGVERYMRPAFAASQQEYLWLGLADSAILCTLAPDVYLLTADHALYVAAGARGYEAEHLDQLRFGRA